LSAKSEDGSHNRDGCIPGDYQYVALTQGNPVQRFWHLGKLLLAREMFRDRSPGRVLDLGCGSGNLVHELAQSEERVVGLHLNWEAVSFSSNRCRGLRTNFVVGEGACLPFSDDKFDRTVIMEVIEHLQKDAAESMLHELCRVTKPGGWLLVTCPNRKSLWPLIERVLDLFRLVPKLRGGQHQQLSLPELSTVLSNAGYRVIRSGTFHLVAPFVAPLSLSSAKRLFRWELTHSWSLGSLIYCIAEKPQLPPVGTDPPRPIARPRR